VADEQLDDDVLTFAQRAFDLAREAETEQIVAYIDAGLPVNLTHDKGDSLLMLPAYYGRPSTVRALLEQGADTARVDDRGQTALAAAVFRRSAESVTALISAGADPALGSPSAIETARFLDLPEMLSLLEAGPPA
jgi:ankyrin repeat protein